MTKRMNEDKRGHRINEKHEKYLVPRLCLETGFWRLCLLLRGGGRASSEHSWPEASNEDELGAIAIVG